jgi:hypothetical protein
LALCQILTHLIESSPNFAILRGNSNRQGTSPVHQAQHSSQPPSEQRQWRPDRTRTCRKKSTTCKHISSTTSTGTGTGNEAAACPPILFPTAIVTPSPFQMRPTNTFSTKTKKSKNPPIEPTHNTRDTTTNPTGSTQTTPTSHCTTLNRPTINHNICTIVKPVLSTQHDNRP